ncbi:MAG: alpha/beta hydrolase [Nitrososphaerota archaeon]|nr:alpha/beta hydrolase [Nitrososphaerota archaeon]
MAGKFLQIQGLRIHYIESGEAGKPKLLLIHGLGGSIESWREIFNELSKSFHVVAMDLPGFGKSDKPPLPYAVDYFADFICRFMESTGFQPATLIGHSMGGMISLMVYLRCREKIEGMVLIDAVGVSDVPARKIREYMGDRWDMERLRKYYRECVLGRMGKLDETRLRDFLQMLEDGGFLRAYLLSLESISRPIPLRSLGEVEVPTLIIWGSDDRVTPLGDGAKLSQVMAKSRLFVVEGAGHSPHSEAPEQVIREIRNFVLKLKSA